MLCRDSGSLTGGRDSQAKDAWQGSGDRESSRGMGEFTYRSARGEEAVIMLSNDRAR